ncbi:proteasome adapter and scaffold protein ECM29 [Microplitis demolitor]|uniref:proteasome adapter and scaffold protein ECM29 n=1 Tax=Microplitis demolitor TaxID=69319 RepID=UPI0004CD07A7|nr:proteasome adapter and scaffold protein ECM29 [Microplitis demolitor]XP_053598631.1 proteasome adapter and scaffold protein ECM29 [Microplitis demolitor]
MAAATDELMLLERVFLCLGNADTDEQLQASVCKFLPPVLLKLSSPQEGVRKKVMGLLIHINRRVKSRPKVQLPVEALLLQYQDPAASSFVINFTIIYIKLGYPRMEMKKQSELIPSVLNAIEGKPLSHQDSLLLMIMPALGNLEIPLSAEKRAALLGLQDKPYVAKQLINFMLDMLLLPYGSVGQAESRDPGQPIDWSQYPVPPGLSEYAFKRVIGENPPVAEKLEQVKLGIVKFLAGGFFPESDILIHLIVAAADTRFSVANLADVELKKIVSTLDWSSMQLALPLYTLFLGTSALGTQKDVKPEMKRHAANTRIRLKLLQYLCRVTKAGFIIPPSIQVVFDSLYGNNTNKKLKTLALDFTLNMVQQCSFGSLSRVAGVILNGMVKLISEGEPEHIAIAYTIIGQLGQRIPSLVNKDSSLVQQFFKALTSTDADMRRTVRDALIAMSSAFVLNRTDECGISTMTALLSTYIESEEPSVRSVAVHYVATIFPADHAPSRYLLLIACGDDKNEVSADATKALYGTAHRNERYKADAKEYQLPNFPEMIVYVNQNTQTRINSNTKFSIGSHVLPYNVTTFNEIINYLRLCLARSARIPFREGSIENHPCQHTPTIAKYLKELVAEDKKYLDNYIELITTLCHATADKIPLVALLEIAGTVPQSMTSYFVKELPWIRSLLTSTKAEVRELAAKINAIVMEFNSSNDEFELQATEFINSTKNKTLETQHGSLLALSHMIERKLTVRKLSEPVENLLKWKIYNDIVQTICSFLTSTTVLLADAATQGIGIIGKVFPLPLISTSDDENVLSKKKIVDNLFAILLNAKMNSKIKENAIQSLGQLCIGEIFPHTKLIIEKFIGYAKETKDVGIHFSIAEALVLCVQGPASKEARDIWTTPADEHNQNYSQESDNFLVFLLDQLLKLASEPHPNSRQAICIWLLSILRHNDKRQHVIERLPSIQNAFSDFLSENNDIVQDVASKGICLVYNTSEKTGRDDLVSNLMNQLTEGRRAVQQVTPDTKLFEEGQLGKAPTGGTITTYKEICSLASDLNKPDLIYNFLQLANHNAVWTSKKGAAFGFSAIASVAKDELNKYLPSIIPKLYRYQFDPTPKIQQSMSNIWHDIVPSTSKALEQYHDEIINDLKSNLTHNHWRVRMSCCLALSDLFKSNAPIDYAKHAPELWKQLFRVMDDIHEDTRNSATNTARLLSKVCIRECDPNHGKSGERVLQSVLPIFLETGILHNVKPIRALSLQTVSQLVSTAGVLLKPSLVNLIPALLTATDMEHEGLVYMSTKYSAQAEIQEALDRVRSNEAKTHHATETVRKCTQYIDAAILQELMPKVIELIKSSIGLGSKVSISHFLILLSLQMKQELQPYAGKLCSALMNGLTDRNATVRKTNAVTIGHIIGSAKDSSIEKIFNTLNTWYNEREDDAIRLAIGQTLQSINNHNHEVLKKFSDIVIPLTFFAMHAIKVPANKETVELWTDLWGEIAHGTETTVKQNLNLIISTLNRALESASWTTKAQAANAVSTVAVKVGSSMEDEARNGLLKILITGLQGRTWNGKERLVLALATLACHSKEALSKDPALTTSVIDALYKESKKDNIEYRRHALKAFADVLHELEIDRFTQLYDIAQEILIKMSTKNADDDDDDEKIEKTSEEMTKKREDQMKLQETVYEALGKAWPSSRSSKDTQDKYCLQIIAHCHDTLSSSTRAIQVAIMTTLTHFVEKLIFLQLNYSELSKNDAAKLNTICETLYQILKISIGISKYTRIRKEALNIILVLSKKLIDSGNDKQLESLKKLFCQLLSNELASDNQPEIRTRVVDIKAIFKL